MQRQGISRFNKTRVKKMHIFLQQERTESKTKVDQDVRLEVLEKQIADLLSKAQVSSYLLLKSP